MLLLQRSWSVHLACRWPGWYFQVGSGDRPTKNSTWCSWYILAGLFSDTVFIPCTYVQYVAVQILSETCLAIFLCRDPVGNSWKRSWSWDWLMTSGSCGKRGRRKVGRLTEQRTTDVDGKTGAVSQNLRILSLMSTVRQKVRIFHLSSYIKNR